MNILLKTTSVAKDVRCSTSSRTDSRISYISTDIEVLAALIAIVILTRIRIVAAAAAALCSIVAVERLDWMLIGRSIGIVWCPCACIKLAARIAIALAIPG